MPFPSISALAVRARIVLVRFPWVLALSVVAAAAAIISIDNQGDDFWIRLSMVAALGLPLSTSISLLAERLSLVSWKETLLQAAGILFLFWFLHVWAGPGQKHDAIRYFQLSIGLHLTVAFAPFLPVRRRGGFWQYNRRLFEAILRAALFTAVLFLGLAVALGAVDKLLGMDVPSATYARLWILLAFVANTWIFLGSVPEDLEALDDAQDYPRGLKVFTQYILTPLVAVYLVILTLYLIKIVVTGSWPSGWIGYLVSSVAVTGILGFLLVHPLRMSEREGWIRTYSRWLFVGLIPAAVMFLLALWKRVGPYGLTELRVLGFLLGGWLLGIALLYTARRTFGIQIIPVSLAAVLLLTLFGPLSATTFSLRSQASRLRALLTANHLPGSGGEARPAISDSDRREISAAIRFLLERHASARLAAAFGGRVPGGGVLADSTRMAIDSTARRILTAMGAEYVPQFGDGSGYFTLQVRTDSVAVPIAGFDYSIALPGSDSTIFYAGSDTLKAVYDSTGVTLQVLRGTDTLLAFPLGALVDSILNHSGYQEVQGGQLRVPAVSRGYRGLLALESINGAMVGGKPRVRGWRGDLYLGGTGEQ